MQCHAGGISDWHLVIGGFTQQLGGRTGVQRLWLAMHAALSGRLHSQCQLHRWRDDWADVAEQIVATSVPSPTVCLYGYSWGGGWGVVQLARQLRARGVAVAAAVLCDAVYRSRWISMSWRSLIGRPRIVLPDNVREVWSFRQANSLPAGHEVVAADASATRVHEARVVRGWTHVNIDDLHEWHALALSIARSRATGTEVA